QVTPAAGIELSLGLIPEQRERLLRLLGQWKEMANFYYGDFYPLTDYSTEESAWMGWQFARSDNSEGMVQVFRRKNSPYETAHMKIRGLDPKARYIVSNADTA